MPRKPAPPRTFKEEKAFWYKRLEESGFEDIETEDGELKEFEAVKAAGLKHQHLYDQLRSQTQDEQRQTAIEATTRYYQLASQFLHSYQFIRHLDKLVWELHSEGASRRMISRVLTKQLRRNIPEWRIRTILDRLQNLMLGGI